MLIKGLMEPRAPALDANLAKVILQGCAEDVPAEEAEIVTVSPQCGSVSQHVVWPRVWPGL